MTTWNPISALRRAARNSPWLVIAITLHVIGIVAAAVFTTAREEVARIDTDTILRPAAPRAPIDEALPDPDFVRNTIPVVPETGLIVDEIDYVPSDQPQSATFDPIGDPEATPDATYEPPSGGTAIGVGNKGQRGNTIGEFRKHTGLKIGKGKPDGTGVPPQTPMHEAIRRGLLWLARHQNPDGSWSAVRLHEQCDANGPCAPREASYVASYDHGLTSLALLAFLGAGVTPQSTAWLEDPARGDRKIVVGEVVKRGLAWLCAEQGEDGSWGRDRPFLYNQALATMALAEAYGMTQARYYRERAQRAVTFLQGAQRPSPTGDGLWGWRYAARQEIERFHRGDTLDEDLRRELFDADTSVTGWAVMALKSAQLSGLEVDPQHLQGALAFARWVSLPDGSAGYLDPKGAGAKVTGPGDHFDYHPAGMSALSMCIRAFTAHDADDPFLEPAAKRLVADLPRIGKDHLALDYYYWYYGSLALFQFDGPDSPRRGEALWKPWNKAAQGALLELQTKEPRSCHDGGWLVPDRWCHGSGPVYATALNVLTLEVAFRYPNAFSVGRKRTEAAPPQPQGVK